MEYNDIKLNPWISMWINPRKTIRQIINLGSSRWILILAAIGGIVDALNNASDSSLGDKYSLNIILTQSIILGAIFGIIGLYIASALLKWTGKWIGGKGESRDIRIAVAWSSVPIVWSLFLWIPELIIFKEELFTTYTPNIDASNMLAILILIFGILDVILGIWALIIFLKSLGEVQGFSVWKALLNTILSLLVIIVPIIILAVIIMSF